MKIMICEDEQAIIDVVKIILEDSSHQIEVCTEGSNLVQRLLQNRPHLLIIDHWLKDTTADKVIPQIRQHSELKSLPIILMSAINNLEQVANNLGVNKFLKKPFNIAELEETVNNFVQ